LAGLATTAFLDSFLEGFEDAILCVCRGGARRDWDRLKVEPLQWWSRAFFLGGGSVSFCDKPCAVGAIRESAFWLSSNTTFNDETA
jgi:hypothetical protein